MAKKESAESTVDSWKYTQTGLEIEIIRTPTWIIKKHFYPADGWQHVLWGRMIIL